MGSFTSHPSTGLMRYPAAVALATISAIGLAIFTVIGASGQPVAQFKNSAGTTVCEIGSGGTLIGACATNLAASQQTANDARYLNVAGDTGTGTLNLNITGGNKNTVSLETPHTISGSVLHAHEELTASGSAVVDGATVLNGSVTINATNHVFSIQSAANQACNTTCTSACIAGQDAGATANAYLACTDAAADTCLCAGAN